MQFTDLHNHYSSGAHVCETLRIFVKLLSHLTGMTTLHLRVLRGLSMLVMWIVKIKMTNCLQRSSMYFKQILSNSLHIISLVLRILKFCTNYPIALQVQQATAPTKCLCC